MDYEKLTNRSKELIQDVIKLAAGQKHQYISPEHLLQALLDDKSGQAADLIRRQPDSNPQPLGRAAGQNSAGYGRGNPKPDVSGFYAGNARGRKTCRQSQ